MNRFCAVASLIALGACGAPSADVTINPAAVRAFGNSAPSTVVPRAPTQTTFAAFTKYCERYRGNRAATEAAVKADGYILFSKARENNTTTYAKAGQPLVAVGNDGAGQLCMVMVQRDPKLGPSVKGYVQRRHKNATAIGTIKVGKDRAENVTMVPGTKTAVYMTVPQRDPILGPVEALAVFIE